MSTVIRLPIDDVIIGAGRRSLDDKAVIDLAESMSAIGLKTPITVRAVNGEVEPASGQTIIQHHLVAGLHRLEAARSLAWSEIDCVVEMGGETDGELWQHSENVYRADLTVMERAEAMARLAALLPAKSGQVDQKSKRGRPKGGTAAAGRALPIPGKSAGAKRKDLERAIKISAIVEEAKQAAKAAGLDDNQQALLAVAAEHGKEAQLKKVTELSEARGRECHQNAGTEKSKPRAGETCLSDAGTPPPQPVTGDGVAVDLLVFTPGPDEIDLLDKPYAEEDRLERSLPPLVRQVANAAVLVVSCRVRDLSVVVKKLLPVCGFRLLDVFLTQHANTRKITDCQIIVVAERGNVSVTLPEDGEWRDDEATDVLALAGSIYPDAKSKVSVFASARVEGWTCYLRDESWVEESAR